jgi:two-component system CheB/CheR fusion protein
VILDLQMPEMDGRTFFRELRALIDEAVRRKEAVERTGVAYPTEPGAERWFDIVITPLKGAGSQQVIGVKITFADITRHRRVQSQLDQTQHALESAYEELQSSNEELETTNEELQSTVEELETTNEELQATNEELETINEELQSTNEELETVNAELVERSDQLNEANNFLESVLASMTWAVIVAGRDLRVRAWNEKATDLWGLRSDEVDGQHLLNLDVGFPMGEFIDPIKACLSGSLPHYFGTAEAVNRRGRSFRCRVAIQPLYDSVRQPEGIIVVIEETEPVRPADEAAASESTPS